MGYTDVKGIERLVLLYHKLRYDVVVCPPQDHMGVDGLLQNCYR